MKILIFIISIMVDVFLLLLFFVLLKFTSYSLDYIRTFIFTALALDSLFYVFACKSFRKTIIKQNFFSNKLLIVAVLIGFSLQMLAVYEPHLQKIFDTVGLSLQSWMLLIALSLLKLITVEIAKYYLIVKKQIEAYA